MTKMGTVTCVLQGDSLVLTTPLWDECTVEDLCERLIEEHPFVFEGLDGPHDLRLYLVTPWDPHDEKAQRSFLNGDLSQEMLGLSVDDETPITDLLPSWEGIRVCVVVVIDKLTSLEESTVVPQGEWFPSPALQLLKPRGVAVPQPFFSVSGLTFGVKIDPPTHVLVRACFLKVFNELVLSVRQAYEDQSTTVSRVLVISGSPGIGKRWFFFYCVFCFLFDDQTINFLPQSFRVVVTARYKTYVYRRQFGVFLRVEDAVELASLARDPSVLRLVLGDGMDPKLSLKPPPPPVETWRGVTIFVASASGDNRLPCSEITPPRRKMWILPVWTLDELRVVNATSPTSRRYSASHLLERFVAFGGNIERVLCGKTKKTHTSYSLAPEWDLPKLLELVKRENGATQRDDSGRYLHMVPDPRVQAGFHLQFTSKELARALVARLLCGDDDFKVAMAFAMDPNANVRCDAVKRVLFEMLCCRRFTSCVHDGVELSIQNPDSPCSIQAPVVVKLTGYVFETTTEGSSEDLLEVLEPNEARGKLALVRILTDLSTVDAILDDFTQQRCLLLSFSTSSNDLKARIAADATADALVSQAMALRPTMELIPVVVVPPWLRDVAVQAIKDQQSTATRVSSQWRVAVFDPTHISTRLSQYNSQL